MTVTEHSLDDVVRNGTKVSPAELNGHASEGRHVSKLRESIPQVCAVMAKNLLLITFGSTLGFPTILLPALQKKNPDVPVSLDDITWISSINLFAVPVGCLVSGPLSQFMGRKKTMLLANIPFIASWILMHYATSAGMLYIALALTGLTGGLVEAPVLTYVAEVTQPHLRGLLAATSTMSIILGVFTQLVAGKISTWRTVALFNILFPLLCATALALVPESPYWLVGKGRVKAAEKALCFLRGWTRPVFVQEELRTITMICQQPSDNSNSRNTLKEKFWEPYLRRSVSIPFALVTLSFFIAAFGGSATLQTFAVSIFDELNAPMDKYTATVWLGVAELTGTLTCVGAIHFTGKRKLNFLSIGGTGLCFFCSAIYSILVHYEHIDTVTYSWLPTTLLIGSAFLSHAGIRILAWILAGEVFPSQVRATATGIAASIGYVFTSIVNKIFLYMTGSMGLSGTFFFYAAMNLAGGIALFIMLPETEGRTLREIEEHYAGINNLKNKPKKHALPYKEKWAASNPAMDNVESKF